MGMEKQTTLKKMLESALEDNGETSDDIVAITVGSRAYNSDKSEPATLPDLGEYEGDIGYGGESLPPFWAWTGDRVYFKTRYDGAERVASLARNPTEEEPPDAYGGG